MKHCSITTCPNKLKCRGYCSTHYKQLLKFGETKNHLIDKHGDSKSTEYRSWAQMKARCYNKNHHAYKRYGGRGITVCDRWRNSYTNFLSDIGRKPSKIHSLDRINPNGNYEPKNCRWANYNQQAATRRNNLQNVGVSFDRKNKSWRASLVVKGERVLYKRFKHYDDAIAARLAAENKYLGKQQLLI